MNGFLFVIYVHYLSLHQSTMHRDKARSRIKGCARSKNENGETTCEMKHHQRRRCRISPSIVLIGQWDIRENKFISLCSGFIVDATRGLIVSGANTPTSNRIYQGDNYRLVVRCNDHISEGFSRTYAAEIMGTEGGLHQLTQPCILRLTHILKLSTGIDSTSTCSPSLNSNTEKDDQAATRRSLTEETSTSLHRIAVTPGHLHSLYELGISEKLDVCKKVHILGYDEYSRRPICIGEGYLDTNYPTMSPNSVMIKSIHQFFAKDQMLGGPCISSVDGRVVGIAIRMMKKTMNSSNASYLMVTAPFIEAIIEEMQMLCDAAQCH